MPASIPPLAPWALPALPPPLTPGGIINEKAFRRDWKDLTLGSGSDRPLADAAKLARTLLELIGCHFQVKRTRPFVSLHPRAPLPPWSTRPPHSFVPPVLLPENLESRQFCQESLLQLLFFLFGLTGLTKPGHWLSHTFLKMKYSALLPRPCYDDRVGL